MVDVTGGTPPTGTSPFRPPDDYKAVYDHFGDESMYSVATAAALPSSGNWWGRMLTVRDAGALYVWRAGWKLVSLPWTSYNPTVTGCTATVNYCQYHVAFDKATVRVSLSISAMTANPTISLPASFPAKVATLEHLMGAVALVPSAGSEAPGYVRKPNATTVTFYAALASGSNLYINNIGPTTPITFAGGKIIATFEYAV